MPLLDPKNTILAIPESMANLPPTPEPASISGKVDLLVRAGSLLLQHGADAGRVEASLEQMESRRPSI